MRLLAGAGVLLALTVAFIAIAIHRLDAPWLKLPLQRWISGVAGFEVDWRSIHVDLGSGVKLEGLEVMSPLAFRDRAPDLFRADTVVVEGSVFAGIRAVRITNADVTLVQAGVHGSWERTAKGATERGQGLSASLAALFSKPPPIPAASLDRGTFTWINVDPGRPIERVSVSGLSLDLQGWTATLGTAATPVRLDLTHQFGDTLHTAVLDVQAVGSAERRGLVASSEMKVARQDWVPNLSVEKLLSLHLRARFDTAQHRIALDLDDLQLLDDAVTFKGAALLPDDPTAFPTVHDMEGAVDLKRLAAFVAPLKLPVSVDRGALHFRAKNTDAIDVDGQVDTVVFTGGGASVSLAGASLTATLQPRGPHFVRAKVNGHCIVSAAGAKPWFDQDVRVHLEADHVSKDFKQARVRGTVAGPWGELLVEDEHHTHEETAHITFRLPSLAVVRPVLPKMPWPVDWGGASAAGSIDVRAQLGSEPARIHQRSEIVLQDLLARLPAGPLAVRSISANVRSEGTDRDHHAEVGLRMGGVQWRGGAPSDQALDATLDFAAATPRVHLILKTDGAFAPSVSTEVQAHFDRGRRELVSELTASASHLSRLAPFLKDVPWVARLDLTKTEATLSGRARVQSISQFEPRLLARARGDAELRGTIRNARWLGEAQSAAISAIQFQATAKGDNQQATVESRLDVQSAEYALEEDSYRTTPTSLSVSAVLKRSSGEVNAHGELNVGQVLVGKSFGYPLEGLKLTFSLERQRDGVIHVPKATLENAAAGTTLELRGGLALHESPPKLSAQGFLTQDLLKVWRNADVFSGQGRAELHFSVESPDLTVFNTSAALTLNGVSLRMPPWGLTAEGVDSEIPLVSTFARIPRGWAVVRGHRLNAYSALRFWDQHPLFKRRSYLSIRRLVTPQLTVESFAGNLKVDHNLISLDQMEMSVRGGQLAGQCLLDTDVNNLRAKTQLRATGVLSSKGEPFDGNASLLVSLHDRSVDGRAEILRIGRQHLLDLLDLQDPQHVAPAFNRVRTALALGYPEQVKITFDRGFANVHIAFGGIAKLVKVDDLRGIPMEPLIDKYLVKYVKEEP